MVVVDLGEVLSHHVKGQLIPAAYHTAVTKCLETSYLAGLAAIDRHEGVGVLVTFYECQLLDRIWRKVS